MIGLLKELKRRKVIRVGIAYLVAAWLLLQVAEVLASILSLPDWAPKLVLFLLVIGFVPALILAWAYELTPQGIKRDTEAQAAPGAATPSKFRGAFVAVGLVLAALVGAGVYWLSGSDERWVRDVAIPQIEQYIESDDWEMAYQTALSIEERVPDSTVLDDHWSEFSVKTSIPTQPEGATVFRRPYHDAKADWQPLGRTPLYDTRIPRGFSLMRIELPGFHDVLRIVGAMAIAGGPNTLFPEEDVTGTQYVVRPVDVVLEPDGPLENSEIRVPGTRLLLDGQHVPLADFRIGQYEVTNREYKAFVDAGGYRQRDYWEHGIVRDGQTLSWEDAMAAFKDTTGRTGPSTWIGGTFPEGQDDFPVGGISWYEAMAYARFAGRGLPSLHHWRRAHAPAVVTWQILKSNIETDGAAPVGMYEGTGWTGTSDMLGNVREWTLNALGDQRAIVGGAWDDLAYSIPATIFLPHALPPIDRSPQNGMRLAAVHDERDVKDRLRRPIKPREPVVVPDPVSDEAFSTILTNFERSPAPLNTSIDETVDYRDWTREHISFDSGNGQRTELLLYLPKGQASRHRTVFYWPSSLAILLTSTDEFRLHVDFMLRSGWAVAMPIFENTFHRGNGQIVSYRTVAGRDLFIRQVREMRRTIDYLETRPDIDTESLAYYGFSWGGTYGAMALAIEPRLKVGILNQAGMPRPGLGDLHPVNYLPRVSQPVLQFNGRYDTNFRYEDSAKPYFDWLGSESKKHVVEPTGHFVPNSVIIGETLAWLDEHLGDSS
ncbi:MAG: SUMF1/EgtB/PvdO family nonheme iron enzyme [Woeseiaceae bacterium]|nr:SUMF1/EgtB/PvdO family nonheme iron enzyme [Woeseiaceae bacterium]